MEKKFFAVSHRFSNGVVVVNTTPHPLTFLDPNGEVVSVPSSVAPGERTGFAVINAKPTTVEVGPHKVWTRFDADPSGKAIIAAIRKELGPDVFIVGSLAAANAYPEVVGMVPAPGFERVPPAEKRMSADVFNVGDIW